jgi:hypothetical protein
VNLIYNEKRTLGSLSSSSSGTYEIEKTEPVIASARALTGFSVSALWFLLFLSALYFFCQRFMVPAFSVSALWFLLF